MRDAALALADLHDIDGHGEITSFVHHDLRAENFLTSNGGLRLQTEDDRSQPQQLVSKPRFEVTEYTCHLFNLQYFLLHFN